MWAGCLCGPDACVGRMLVWAGCLCGPDACVGRMLVWAGCLCGPDACVGRMLVWAGCLCGPANKVQKQERARSRATTELSNRRHWLLEGCDSGLSSINKYVVTSLQNECPRFAIFPRCYSDNPCIATFYLQTPVGFMVFPIRQSCEGRSFANDNVVRLSPSFAILKFQILQELQDKEKLL